MSTLHPTTHTDSPAAHRVREVDTAIIGGGQAGLTVARALGRRGIDCLVLEAGHQVGDQWRHRYDSLRLFTTKRFNGLPGMAFPGPSRGFATKDEVADFLQAYADRWTLDVWTDARVHHLDRDGNGFRVQTARGTVRARHVVIATGPYGDVMNRPPFAADLDPGILQLTALEYRRPGQLQPGPVLVVGAGHSGCDIALEFSPIHRVTLAGRDTGEVPVPWDSPLLGPVMTAVMLSHRHVHTRGTARGRRDREQKLGHGIPRLRVKRHQLEAAGVDVRPVRVTGTFEGRPQLADGTVVEVTNVVWAVGCRHDYSWLDLPVLDETGWPREFRGVADDVDGLFFCGLAYQYSLASQNFYGVGRDAEYVAGRIAARNRRAGRNHQAGRRARHARLPQPTGTRTAA